MRIIVFILCFSITVQAAVPACPADISEVTRFQELWSKDFSRFPGPQAIEDWLRDKLLAEGKLDARLRGLLEKGHSPLALDTSIVTALSKAYRHLIARSSLSEEQKRKLEAALDKAVLSMREGIPFDDTPGDGDGGGGGGDSSPGDDDPLRQEIERHIKKKGLQRCIVRTAILFFVSNFINTAGALEAKWERYAGGKGALDGVFDETTWSAAMQDKDFRHNVTWNAILMISLGAFSCLDKNVGKNLMTALSAGTSVAGQYATSGEVSIRQTLLDAFFVRWISVNKSNLAFRLAESYSRRGLPAKHLAEILIQGVSEGFGAYAYPRANDWTKRLWRD